MTNPMTLRQLLEQLNKLDNEKLDSDIWFIDISSPRETDELVIEIDELGLSISHLRIKQ